MAISAAQFMSDPYNYESFSRLRVQSDEFKNSLRAAKETNEERPLWFRKLSLRASVTNAGRSFVQAAQLSSSIVL
jgi:hypothetical protein